MTCCGERMVNSISAGRRNEEAVKGESNGHQGIQVLNK